MQNRTLRQLAETWFAIGVDAEFLHLHRRRKFLHIRSAQTCKICTLENQTHSRDNWRKDKTGRKSALPLHRGQLCLKTLCSQRCNTAEYSAFWFDLFWIAWKNYSFHVQHFDFETDALIFMRFSFLHDLKLQLTTTRQSDINCACDLTTREIYFDLTGDDRHSFKMHYLGRAICTSAKID